MLPMRMPEKTSWPTVVIAGSYALPGRSALVPGRQRHHDRLVRGERLREHLVVAVLLPLPDADRRAQIAARVLRLRRPVVVGELDAAAVDQAAFRQVELERDLAQLGRLEGLGFRQHLGEQRPDGGEARAGMTRGCTL